MAPISDRVSQIPKILRKQKMLSDVATSIVYQVVQKKITVQMIYGVLQLTQAPPRLPLALAVLRYQISKCNMDRGHK